MIKVKIKNILKEAVKMICPPATQDLELNTTNRDAAIQAKHIQYGPLNVKEPADYWKDIAEYWDKPRKQPRSLFAAIVLPLTSRLEWKSVCPVLYLMKMVSLVIVGCTTLSVIPLVLVELMLVVDLSRKMMYHTSGKKEMKKPCQL